MLPMAAVLAERPQSRRADVMIVDHRACYAAQLQSRPPRQSHAPCRDIVTSPRPCYHEHGGCRFIVSAYYRVVA